MSTIDGLGWPQIGDTVCFKHLGKTQYGTIKDKELSAKYGATQYVYVIAIDENATVRKTEDDVELL